MPGDEVLPGSPTKIDPEIQAQASTLLPELAREVNKVMTKSKARASEQGSRSIKSPPSGTLANPSDMTGVLQKEREIQCAILQSRIPANLKGKEKIGREGIHEDQAMTSLHRTTPHSAMVSSHTHNINTEEGWETAKIHRRKRNGSEAINPSAHRAANKDVGSLFFKNRMGGRCFNCFSPNHIAPACHRPPRCWKCYLLGHRAKDCIPISNSREHNPRLHYKEGDWHKLASTHNCNPSSKEHKIDHRSFCEGGQGSEERQGGARRHGGGPVPR